MPESTRDDAHPIATSSGRSAEWSSGAPAAGSTSSCSAAGIEERIDDRAAPPLIAKRRESSQPRPRLQQRPTERANIARAKKLIAAPLPSIDPAAEHDDVDPAAGALEDHSADLALLVAIG